MVMKGPDIFVGVCVLFLTACTVMQNPEENRGAVCKELKRQIIVNGATGNQNVATQQRVDMDTLERSYREEGCE